jgi:hypothetical protein
MRLFLVLTLLFLAATAHAAPRVFVTLQDDGTIEQRPLKSQADLNVIHNKLLKLYKATGEPMPEIMSVWTTFSFGQNDVGTIFDTFANDVTGIGLETAYPPTGLKKSSTPPLRSILFHNNVLSLADRTTYQNAPVEGYARYLFLLELSHNWGPALQLPLVPLPGGGTTTADELMGSPLHWSFWMDAGGSPAGGNIWTDNGDGTFTITANDPAKIQFTMLDLYIMGLAKPEEVPPFGILENPIAPAGILDPLQGGVYKAHSLTYFDTATPFTAKATRRKVTMDDVVKTNGPRVPAYGAAPTSWKYGMVLLVSKDDTPDAIAAAQALFDPLAAAMAPAFHTATHDRGTLEVVTYDPDQGTDEADAGTVDADNAPDVQAAVDAGSDIAAPASEASKTNSGCTAARSPAVGNGALFAAACLLLAVRSRKRKPATASATLP